jgi:hypothetical protein
MEAKYLVSAEEMEQSLRGKKGILLTDNYAPVDSLTAPLFRDNR